VVETWAVANIQGDGFPLSTKDFFWCATAEKPEDGLLFGESETIVTRAERLVA